MFIHMFVYVYTYSAVSSLQYSIDESKYITNSDDSS